MSTPTNDNANASVQQDAPNNQPQKAKGKNLSGLKAKLLIGFAALLLLAGVAWGLHYWLVGRFYETTDDAYLQADNAVISPQVGGIVTELYVTDNQLVTKGRQLLTIDSRDYRAHMAQSQADVASAKADLDNADAQIARQGAAIVQAQAQAQFASTDAQRYADLVEQGAASRQMVQKSRTESQTSSAALDTQRKQLDVLKAQREKAAAGLQHAQALLDQDKLNLDYTGIAAPIDGAVADRSVRIGEFVQPGARLLTIVPVQAIYLIANFKETQTSHMYRGDPVAITVDSFPDKPFKGHIDSLTPGTGAQFALLPPENATGNFTRIVQRVPVKITFDQGDERLKLLRPGLSATAKVDIHNRDGNPKETLIPSPPASVPLPAERRSGQPNE